MSLVYTNQRAVPDVEGDGWVAVGSGWTAYQSALTQCYAYQFSDISGDAFPHAKAIAELAIPMFAAGLGLPAAEAAPVYIRNKVALKTAERLAAKS